MIKRIGKRGKANINSRKEIARICEDDGLVYCELQLPPNKYAGRCGIEASEPLHRHKRDWYAGDEKKLADRKQWIAGCRRCHNIIEDDKELTEEVFMQLRGPE
ncbi:MAG TPA: hypothetical protein DDY21_00075 [Candidatus Moranbacteria bacterium]|nr:hypothetical protein [Candidatus Moranbacteria bacterium]